MVGAGPWARIAPGVDHGEGTPPKARARRPLDGPGAHRVGGLRGPSPLRGRTDRGRQVVADIAHRHARAYKLMIIESRPPGPALSLAHQARGERARPAPWEATGLEGAHLRINGPWPHSRSSCWDAPTEPTRPSRSPGDRSAQRPARVPGPLFEQSGEQAIGPSDHRPRPNRSARTSRPTPQTNATAPPHPRPPTRAITSSVITYRSFQIKGIHRQLNTPAALPAPATDSNDSMTRPESAPALAPAPLRHHPHHLGRRHAGRTRAHSGLSGAVAH